MRATARLAAAALLAAAVAPPARSHDVVDSEWFQQALLEVVRARREAQAPEAGPEALYRLGEKIEAAVDLLNQQAAAHGEGDLLTRLAADRVRACGVRLTFSERERRYGYDLAAFGEYLRRAPSGPSAAAAWYRLLARAFHEATGDGLVAADVAAVARAAEEEERFLRRYPDDQRAGEVRFFLAVDYYRLAMAEATPRRARYRRLGIEALKAVRERQPGSMEARTAETLLAELTRRPALEGR